MRKVLFCVGISVLVLMNVYVLVLFGLKGRNLSISLHYGRVITESFSCYSSSTFEFVIKKSSRPPYANVSFRGVDQIYIYSPRTFDYGFRMLAFSSHVNEMGDVFAFRIMIHHLLLIPLDLICGYFIYRWYKRRESAFLLAQAEGSG